MRTVLGIVTLLDENVAAQVRDLWLALESEFGVRGGQLVPLPHFSYHVASRYEQKRARLIMSAWSRQTHPFTVRAEGIGIFAAPEPVVYVPVTRTPALCQLHSALWSSLESAASGSVAYYAPERWVPHITLAQGDITAANLGAIVAWLNDRPPSWDLRVDNFALLAPADANPPGLLHRYELQTQGVPSAGTGPR